MPLAEFNLDIDESVPEQQRQDLQVGLMFPRNQESLQVPSVLQPGPEPRAYIHEMARAAYACMLCGFQTMVPQLREQVPQDETDLALIQDVERAIQLLEQAIELNARYQGAELSALEPQRKRPRGE